MRGTDRRSARRVRRYAGIAAAAAISLLATACSSGSHTSGPSPAQLRAQASASAKAHAAALAKDLKITPADGSHGADPSAGISVTAVKGTLTKVTVRTSGDAVSGSMSGGGKTWHSARNLDVSQSYTVTATGTAGGEKITTTSTFRTLAPAQTFSTQIFEGYQQSYGVGMPIILTFSAPITDKAAVERSLELTTSKPVIGAWYWDGDQRLYFRPRDYWPAYTTVSLTGRLNGVEGAKGVYGARNLTQTFDIGRALVAVASTTSHRTQIYLNGKLAYQWPISTGRASLPTPDGTYLSVEKANPVRMVGGGAPGSAGVLQRAGQLRGPVHLQRRLLPLGPLVGGEPGHLEREPRVREPAARRRADLLQHVHPRRPDHRHRQHGRGQVGRRLDRVVPALVAVPEGERARPGRAGRPAGQHVRLAVVAARRRRQRPARHLRGRQLLRRLGEPRVAAGGPAAPARRY